MDSALALGGVRVAAAVRRTEEKNILRVDALASAAAVAVASVIHFRVDSSFRCCF